MSPHTFLCVGVHEPRLAVRELSRMADGHVIGEAKVSEPFIGEDETIRIAVALDQRNECVSSAIRDDLQQTLFELPRDAAENPLRSGDGLIPFRRSW